MPASKGRKLTRIFWLFLVVVVFGAPLPAQVNPAGSWRTLHTEHFRLHFRAGYDSVAQHAAREAERAYTLLSRELVPPRQDVDIVLSDAADFSNGAASIFPSNRITLLLAPPTAEPDLQNYDDWLRTVIVHELTHIFHLDRVKGPWRLVQSVLGRVPGAFPNLYQPSWVTEGIATWYESHLTGRGRVYGSLHTEVLLSSAGGGRWPRPNEATYISEHWPDGVAPYAFGSRFFERLAVAGGDSAVSRLVERTSGQWVPTRTGRPLRLATGFRRDSLWQDLADDYRRQVADRPPSRSEVIARGMRLPPAPAVSRDGAVAWFEASEDAAPQIVIRRADGRLEHHLTTGGVDLAWAGDTLYATRLELENSATYRSDLYRLAGGRWQRLTHGQRLTDLAVAAGQIVAVQLGPEGNRLVQVGGDSIRPRTEQRLAGSFASPAISPAGRLAAAWHYRGFYHLRLQGDSAGNVFTIGQANEVLADPNWVTDDTLLYVSDRSGLPQVYLTALDGEPVKLTDEPYGARQPGVHGGWLYFSSMEADGWAVRRTPWPTGPAAQDMGPGVLERPLPEVASPTPVRATGYAAWPALRPHYFIPYLVDKGAAGLFIGGFTSGSDPLGRLAYSTRLAGGFEGGRLDASLYFTYRRWASHSVDLYLGQDHGDAGLVVFAPDTLPVVSRERDAEIGFNSTGRRWYRAFTLRVAADFEEDHFSSDPDLDFINPSYGAASVGIAAGRTLRPPLAISDEDGATMSLRYRRRWRLDREGGSDEWRGRLALYQALKGLGGFAHPVLAGRVSAATSSGPDRETFGVGGASGITYQPLPGIVVGSGRAFPVRGFEAGELRGGTVAVGSAELRIPIALVVEPFWDLPYGVDRVSLRLFYDHGRAWEPPFSGRPGWIHSAGVEVTWDLVVLYDVPLRLRTGAALALSDGTATRRGTVRLGLGFDSEF